MEVARKDGEGGHGTLNLLNVVHPSTSLFSAPGASSLFARHMFDLPDVLLSLGVAQILWLALRFLTVGRSTMIYRLFHFGFTIFLFLIPILSITIYISSLHQELSVLLSDYI